jgi:hypothetical protein
MDDLFEHLMESERDRAINGFYTHFVIFLAVITALAVFNLVTGEFWIQWVVLGWGLGIALHAFLVFIRNPRREIELREKRRARMEAKAAAEATPAPAGTGVPAAPAPATGDPGKPV